MGLIPDRGRWRALGRTISSDIGSQDLVRRQRHLLFTRREDLLDLDMVFPRRRPLKQLRDRLLFLVGGSLVMEEVGMEVGAVGNLGPIVIGRDDVALSN